MEQQLITSDDVCQLLEINHNNLHQIQYRKQIKWIEKKGKRVFYDRSEIEAYKAKRDKRGSK